MSEMDESLYYKFYIRLKINHSPGIDWSIQVLECESFSILMIYHPLVLD